MLCQELSKEGFGRSSSLAPDSTLSLSGIPRAHDRSEVDHPAMQTWKRQRLAEAQIALPPWLILVPVDFEQDNVEGKLVAAGFQQNSPAFFTRLGVVPYPTQNAIGRTLDYMSSIQNSEVVSTTWNLPRHSQKSQGK
jgi:hypothetical protein